MAVQASLDTINSDRYPATSSVIQDSSNLVAGVAAGSSFQALELLAATDSDPSSTYHLPQLQTSVNAPPLEGSSFPPLPVATRRNQQTSKNKLKGSGKNTMAARLRHQNNVGVLNSARAWPAVDRQPNAGISNTLQSMLPSSSGFSQTSAYINSPVNKTAIGSTDAPPSHASSSKTITLASHERVSGNSEKPSIKITGTTKLNHSASTPNLVGRGAFDCSKDNFPPVSDTITKQATASTLINVEDARAANKSLVEKIRAGLQFDEDSYDVFKVISGEYRQGLIQTGEYVAYVHQFGLSHLLPELTRLCPDAKKQQELLKACSTSMWSNGPSENSADKKNSLLKLSKNSKKGKEKVEGKSMNTPLKPDLGDSIISSVRELQLNHRPPEEEVEILSKDGYRSMKGKSKIFVADERSSSNLTDRPSTESTIQNDSMSAGSSLKKAVGGNKPRKKTSKFHRARLGEDSLSAVLSLADSNSMLDQTRDESVRSDDGPKKLPGGAWRDGGGRKLVAKLR